MALVCCQWRLRGEQVEIVQGCDHFATGDEFLERTAILQRTVVDDAQPEIDRGGVERRGPKRGVDHDCLISSRCATFFRKLEKWVANGTRTRNSQNHNLELYH